MQWLLDRPRLLGALTWWPLLYMVLFFAVWSLGMIGMVGGGVLGSLAQAGLGHDAAAVAVAIVTLGGFVVFPLLMVLHLFTMIEIVAMVAVYVLIVLADEALDSNARLMWIVIVVMAGTIGQLIYFHQRLRPAPV